MNVTLSFTKFTPAWQQMLAQEAPEKARKAVTAVASAIRDELVRAAPVGGPPNTTRAAKRAKYKTKYGPLVKSFRVRGAKEAPYSLSLGRRHYRIAANTAVVFEAAFYARFVEFGTAAARMKIARVKTGRRERGPSGRMRNVTRANVVKTIVSYRRRAMYHPRGQAPHPFIQPVLDRAGTIAEQELARVLR